MTPPSETMARSADQQAADWLANEQSVDRLVAGCDAPEALALGWSLKAQCQAAWHRQPGLAQRTALGLQRLCEDHPSQAPLQGLSEWAQGLSALVAGDMARALLHLQQGAACFDQLGQADVATQLRVPCLVALSMLGRHDDALALSRQLLDQLRGGHDELTRGKVALNRGSMLLRLDRYQEAATSYRQAAVAFAHAGDLAHSVMADIGLASTLTWQFAFNDAALMLARARQRAQAHELPVLEALALGEIGQLHLHRGELARALAAFEQACDLLAGRAPPQRCLEAERARVDTLLAARLLPEARQACTGLIEQAAALQAPMEGAWARLMRAEAALLAEQWRPAVQDMQLARADFLAQSNEMGAARADLLLARAHLQQGRAELAADAASSASEAFQHAGLTRWRLESQIALARAWSALGQTDAASALLQSLAEEAGDSPQRATCEWARAELAASLGHWEEAALAAEDSARRHAALRRQVPSGDMRMASQLDAQATDDLRVLLAARRQDGEGLLQAMEDSRARALHDALADAAAGGTQEDAQDQPLRLRLNWLQQQWQQAQAEGAQDRALALQAPLLAAEAQWQQQQRRAAAQRNEVQSDASLTAPCAPQALIRQLGPHRGLLMFHERGDRWHAVLLGPRGLQQHEGEMAPVRAAQRQLRLQLDGMRAQRAAADPHGALRLERIRQVLASLYQSLLAPFSAALAEASEWVILPHRSLHALPWAALQGPQGPLVARCALVLAPSLTAWQHCEQRPALSPQPASSLVLGAGGASLPGVRDEALGVARLLGPECLCRVDDAATLDCWARDAAQAELLHLACHASARSDNPGFSALHLHDGLLSLHDVAARPLAARLVVLSACDTLISQVAAGDELLGLARGFLLAGARAVLATLWSVPDGSTAACMQWFHQGLRQGLSPAQALQQAQQQVAQQWPHPFHWAPFVLLGAN